ncbi:hypothetical protein [Endozoicomonas lisbonensis]|uniref:Alpha/beta-fold hydrolase n=1 Tax=Endozoicomonas lisbonensis TaxID=3120522 RepID=A0ABV2SM53_9GAMM
MAVSVPFRLDHCARQMNQGASRMYRNRFLNNMHQQMHDKLLLFRQQGWNDRSPTLIIHSSDDSFMTPDSVPKPEELSNSTQLELTHRGGHVGFIGGRPNHLNYWLEQRIPEFLAEHKP